MHISAERPFLAMTLNAWQSSRKPPHQADLGGEYGGPMQYGHVCRDDLSEKLVKQELLILLVK
jgi:hypothetical protein